MRGHFGSMQSMEQSRGHFGSMQNAWSNLVDNMVSCKLHGTISWTIWSHANCTGQSREHYGFMQIARDNLAE